MGFGLWVLGVLGGLRGCLCFMFCGSGLVDTWVSGFGIWWWWGWVCGFFWVLGLLRCCCDMQFWFLGLTVLGWFVWVVCVSRVLGEGGVCVSCLVILI